jgi:hypothetical protein
MTGGRERCGQVEAVKKNPVNPNPVNPVIKYFALKKTLFSLPLNAYKMCYRIGMRNLSNNVKEYICV